MCHLRAASPTPSFEEHADIQAGRETASDMFYLSATPQEAQVQQSASPAPSSPPPHISIRALRSEEKRLGKKGVPIVGSRRRRAALKTSSQIPFEQLPYQCFQEARKILQADREEKIHQIEVQRARIARLEAQDAAVSGGELYKKNRLDSMRRHLEELKILADINDPLIKKRFEDGLGNMNRPIYRYLADRKWRQYKRLILDQRITQHNIVPDVLPNMDPVADVDVAFSQRIVQPGDVVESRRTEKPPTLRVQVFDKGERLVTVAVIDSDVPNVEKDAFDFRCHFLACNVPLSPVTPSMPLGTMPKENVVLPWQPPFAQKGAPWQRMSVFILQQREGKIVDVAAVKENTERHGFVLRSFVDRHLLKPVGVGLFRSKWDEWTEGVMKRADIEGADIEFKRKKIEPLPYKKKDGARYR
ncbi:hypothetical protein W97_03372 [Coniosporium apollinis CBS 100218]|uniref:Large ribosomal subunit protein mL38 n=1 Tax=Coniosporium apollinis (strain CBS 100218) TaxID=1168221 RepID=R7YQH3_CONA1|nr:uncharacterized protein W97_03372 [Coniosporium apollinis CBS 100218]EON64142.1 hypothetical protein W97_03372 [Coniosporium apollinis CBS 100218]